ncbi:10709_t:CDS:2, partial [Racocetra fulgida]
HFATVISLRQADKAIQRSNDQVIINPYTLEGSNPILKKSQILGVKEIPKSNDQINRLSWLQRLCNVFDKEKNKQVREKLIREYNTPYWKDLIELRKDGEKLWEANPELVSAEDPILFEALGMNNLYRGYTFLVDSNCKIRWSAHGKATSNELETMLKLTKFLGNE